MNAQIRLLGTVAGLIISSTPSFASDATSFRYQEIVTAFNTMVAGRTLESDDGSEINYTRGMRQSQDNYLVSYSHSFPSGRSTNGIETVWTDGRAVLVDQVIDGVIARRYVASLEGPYNVLRIRPEYPEDSGFISRDCVRKNDQEGTVCYVKVRYMSDVIVTVYRETDKSRLSN